MLRHFSTTMGAFGHILSYQIAALLAAHFYVRIQLHSPLSLLIACCLLLISLCAGQFLPPDQRKASEAAGKVRPGTVVTTGKHGVKQREISAKCLNG